MSWEDVQGFNQTFSARGNPLPGTKRHFVAQWINKPRPEKDRGSLPQDP
jgi:hypothetical protein